MLSTAHFRLPLMMLDTLLAIRYANSRRTVSFHTTLSLDAAATLRFRFHYAASCCCCFFDISFMLFAIAAITPCC